MNQLRLPLGALVGRGVWPRNTQDSEVLIRAIVKRLPYGSAQDIADRIGCRLNRVYDEHSQRVPATWDVTMRSLDCLQTHEQVHVLDRYFLFRYGVRSLPYEQRYAEMSIA